VDLPTPPLGLRTRLLAHRVLVEFKSGGAPLSVLSGGRARGGLPFIEEPGAYSGIAAALGADPSDRASLVMTSDRWEFVK
jgi:hypothetical protein